MTRRLPERPTVVTLLGILSVVGCQHAAPRAAPDAPPSASPVVTPMHPLDGLTPDEYKLIVQLVSDKTQAKALFPLIELEEPSKEAVLAWKKGDPIPRVARAVVRTEAKNFVAIIDLSAGAIREWTPATGEPMVLFEEFIGASEAALKHPDMIAGLAARGLKPEQVYCLPLSAGNFFDGQADGRRLMKAPCFVVPNGGSNWFSRPVEGLFATVDLNTSTVIAVTDTGMVPVSDDPWGYTEAEVAKRYPLRKPNTAPPVHGAPDSISIDGSFISWDIWRFHLRTEKRPGVVLSQVQVQDQARWRSVLYQAYVSEVFVPYMDPSEAFYFRTYMDSGEYGFGLFMSPLRPGVDCPRYARFLSARVHTDQGDPLEIPQAICVFERQTGDAAWRHFEVFAQQDKPTPAEGRPWTELVVRSASEIGNYDYYVDYVFQQDGKIRVMIGSSGIDAVKGVATRSMNDASAAVDTQFGTLVAPNLVATNHDHFFNFRFDFDIDGRQNNFMRTALVPGEPAPDAPRRSFWVTETQVAETEDQASYRVSYDTPAMYHVGNPNVESGLGHKPTYMLVPLGGVAYSPLDVQNDPPAVRNAYIDKTFWVTPHDPSQRYAGGTFAFQSDGSDTLPRWTKAKRSVDNTDIVVWTTVGFHHVPHMEDWPVMPTMWKGVMLAPFNFFDHNPAITIRNSK